MQIDFVEREYRDEDGKLTEQFWDLLDGAAGAKEANDKYSEVSERFEDAVIPESLKGADHSELPDSIKEAVRKFDELICDHDCLAKRVGFNAGYAAGLAEGVLLGKYGRKAG